jgi:glycosyltransferase involved in cell wall biosynthesis
MCHRYYDRSGGQRAVGGVETYVHCLAELVCRHGWEATILQYGDVDLDRMLDDRRRLIFTRGLAEATARVRQLIQAAPGIVVYSDFGCLPGHVEHPSIMVQHGIWWDYVVLADPNPAKAVLKHLRNRWRAFRRDWRIKGAAMRVDCVICVDTHFRMWLQTRYPVDRIWGDNMVYIPNFANVPPPYAATRKWEDGRPLRCICPRRLSRERGVVMFAEVAARLAAKYPAVEFAFIGDGPNEVDVRSLVRGLPNVSVYARPYEQMPAEYEKAHLAVIPTLYSEGTSLACIEAMAAGCAVVVTSVGGLGNLVLPGFNGLICQPNAKQVETTVEAALTAPAMMRRLGHNARLAAEQAFSKAVWEQRIIAVLEEVRQGIGGGGS